MKPVGMPGGYWKEEHPDWRAGRTKALECPCSWHVCRNSEEARGLELILGRSGSSRELDHRGSQRTLYSKSSEIWKLCILVF